MDVALGGIFVLTGVLVGAGLTAVLDLWRQVLSGRAAARIVRLEIHENINRCVQSVANRHPGIKLANEAWRDLRVQLAPLLPDEAVLDISIGYGALFIVEDWISKIQQKYDEAKGQIQQWSERMIIHVALLKQLENRSRLAQMADLLRGRPTFPPPRKGEKPSEEQLEEMKQKLFEAMER